MAGVAGGLRGHSGPCRPLGTGVRRVGLVLALALGLAGGAREGGGQTPSALHQARRGWLGVSLEYVTVKLSGQDRTVAAVSAVVPGSPAERAGIQAGDTLTHVDGQAVSPRVVAAMSEGLAPGDRVRLALRRQGKPREVVVEAAPWPSFPSSYPHSLEFPFFPGPWLLPPLDSIRGAILRNLDSVALAIRPGQGRLTMSSGRVPPGADSLRRTLEQVNRAVAESRRTEGEGQLRRFQEGSSRGGREGEAHFWTPLRIFSVGQSFLAGAQLQDLNPQLARYFPVGQGVLVTQVLEGTPAAEAGVQGGDVIVKVGPQEVTRLEELRAALASAQGPLRLEVVRKDGRKVLVIPR